MVILRAALAALLVAALGISTVRAAGPPAGSRPRQRDVARATPSEAGKSELEAALREIVEGSALTGSRTGVLVADVESGQVLYARDADALLNPASNVKLVTSAVALARLGPEYRFSTELLVDGAAKGSPSAKALHVRGKGDPTLVTERLWAIAGEVAHLGLRRVGDVVVDDTFFDDVRAGPGFDQESGDRSYLAPAGAASLNWNTVAVHVGPAPRRGQRARVEVEPASDHFQIENRVKTVGPRGRRHVTVSSVGVGGKQRIVVGGRIPLGSRTQVARKRIDDPALYLGHTLKRLLQLRGVAVTGRVRLGATPAGARLVHVARSESLGEIVRRLNKTSNNFVAEQIIKTVGAEVKGTPGTWAKGIAATEEFLAEVGIPRGSYVMKNGSGLNDTNRFSARQIVALLSAMWKRFPLQPEYVASLPVAGRDGTIRWRMEGTEAVGRLRAKTGTLVEGTVSSLSGYVETASRRTLAFSVLVNDYAGRPAGVVRSVDAIGSALAASGGAPGAVGAAIAASRGAPATATTATPADLAAALKTYYALGRAGDERNLHLLRTALRTETEPALRLAVAECVYLSGPDDETSWRTFVDEVPADPHVFARLWLAGADEEPRPVLSSLGDLAGAGTPEALAKLVEIAPASAADGALAAAIAEVLAEVAAAAPEELVLALRAAPAAAQDAAVGVLGAGLARTDDREHPFAGTLRMLAAKQGDVGAFARSLEPRVAAAIAAGTAAHAAPALVPAAGRSPARRGE